MYVTMASISLMSRGEYNTNGYWLLSTFHMLGIMLEYLI